MKQFRNQHGLVSLVTTVVISILLCIVVISMVGLMSLLQHQSTDSSDSIRAYYAAEAGIEDGLYKIEQALLHGAILPTGNVCNSSGTALQNGVSNGPQYTCQLFSNVTNSLTGVLTQNGQPLQIDLAGSSGPIDHITISWNAPGQDSALGPNCNLPNDLAQAATELNNPTGPALSWNCPAVLELITVPYSNTNNPIPSTDIIAPGTLGGTYSYNYGQVITGACATSVSPTDPYNCQVTINGFVPNNFILRLKSVLAGTHYRIQAFGASGNVVSIPSQFETIDVTARVGDAYRRVVEAVPVNTGAANLDYVLYADNSICKNISVSVVTGVIRLPLELPTAQGEAVYSLELSALSWLL